jgi:hypothetical protein
VLDQLALTWRRFLLALGHHRRSSGKENTDIETRKKMEFIRYGILLIAIAVGFSPASYADEIQIAEERLTKARDEHKEAIEAVRADILAAIQKKIQNEQKRKKPDQKTLEDLQSQLTSLESTDPPTPIDQTSRKAIDIANKSLKDAMLQVKTAYLRANELAKARKIDEEIEALVNPKKATPKNPFTKGTVWVGDRETDDPKNPTKYKLRITHQEGATFQGEFSFSDRRAQDWIVKGVVLGDRVEMDEVGGGKYRMKVVGKLKDDFLEYEFAGSKADGGTRRGKGNVKLLK